MNNQLIRTLRKQFLNQKYFKDIWFLPQLKTESQKIPKHHKQNPTNNDTIANIIKKRFNLFWVINIQLLS